MGDEWNEYGKWNDNVKWIDYVWWNDYVKGTVLCLKE